MVLRMPCICVAEQRQRRTLVRVDRRTPRRLSCPRMNPYMHTPLRLSLNVARTTRDLLIMTVVCFVAQMLLDAHTGGAFSEYFSLSRAGLRDLRIWQPFTYMFLHADVIHLLFNMLVLGIFGREVELALGSKRYLMLYIGAGVLAGLAWTAISAGPLAECSGSSGAVFAVIGAFAGIAPHRQITLLVFFVLPVTMTARMMALSLGVVTLLMLLYGDPRVAHIAHLVGGVIGYFVARRWGAPLAWTHGQRRPPPFPNPIRNWMAHRRRKQLHLAPPWEGPVSSEDLDRLLDKINEDGIASLTRRERETLEKASRDRGGA